MVKWVVVMKIQPSIWLDDWGKPRKYPSQVGRHRDLNPGLPECESRALPRSHLAMSKGLVLNETGLVRKQGRPKLRWLDSVTNVLATMGVRSWRRKAQEREVWKGIVEEDKAQLGLGSWNVDDDEVGMGFQ